MEEKVAELEDIIRIKDEEIRKLKKNVVTTPSKLVATIEEKWEEKTSSPLEDVYGGVKTCEKSLDTMINNQDFLALRALYGPSGVERRKLVTSCFRAAIESILPPCDHSMLK